MLKFFSALLLAAMFIGCSESATTEAPAATEAPAEPAPSGEPIKVGLLAPLTGAVPTFGQSTREGAELAVQEWNAKGGINGMQIGLLVEDSQSSAGPAVKARIASSNARSLISGPPPWTSTTRMPT